MKSLRRSHDFYIFDPEINASKMIFLCGPRQVGKTTFVKNKLNKLRLKNFYFNWDDPYVMKEYLNNPHFLKGYLARVDKTMPLVAFDEIHKHKKWKNILKGLYDIHYQEAQFIITGSARLDFFKKSGDSLLGRYFSYRMLPVGLVELLNNFKHIQSSDAMFKKPQKNKLISRLGNIPKKSFKSGFDHLFTYGGFPEPLLKASKRFSTKWKRDYLSLLVSEDIRDITRVMDLKGLEQLILMLPDRIGSLLSINALAGDLNVHFSTVSLWIEALKKIYLIFTVKPWVGKINKAIKKERKLYFFDWTIAKNPGAKLENMISVALLRYVSRLNEYGEGNYEIGFVRNIQKQEVDFILLNDNKPVALFEVKLSGTKVDSSGYYYSKRLAVPYFQIVAETDDVQVFKGDCFIIPAWRLLALLG